MLSWSMKHFTKSGHKNIYLQEEFWLLTVVCVGIIVTDGSGSFLVTTEAVSAAEFVLLFL